ncbi:orotidine 5'-phosphate decarboxylase [Frankia sp. CcI49]|uniref:orotidine-5'-phosphate decarboxylase n=1 Tax=unclassified Frankia TaxID=2632575 RepID=UPI0006CA1F92|nr:MULTISPECIES: orotidine-5'-phosphate decarboxylase [unclassified Frankia]KPM55293.1 orotidine 5'-phosphate decarboxylase [Frankia sp. R43]ONH53382.1 orotidine 5'-phosphate decarboxylase [Frankia sp. CcI49]
MTGGRPVTSQSHSWSGRLWVPPAGRPPIAVALDAPDGATALDWARAVAPHCAVLKIGLELFLREGGAVVNALRDEGLLVQAGSVGSAGAGHTLGSLTEGDHSALSSPADPAGPAGSAPELFLDLKLHDIPATVAGGMRSLAVLAPRFVTVHAAGGAAMIRAAVEAAPEVHVTAVTVLTSLDAAALASIGLSGPPSDAVRRLAVLAVEAGARALVCSPKEASLVRGELGETVTLITPGVRPEGSEQADQARVATPERALADGSDLLVIGRPITSASDRAVAAATLAARVTPLR